MPTHGRRWPLDRVDDGYTVTDPETGQVRHFVDQPNGELALLAQIDDRNNRWITFEYDETGAPTSIVHHGGYHLKLTTNDGNRNRPYRHSDRADRRVGCHRLARPEHPVGHHGLGPGQQRVHSAALPRTVLRPRDRAPLQLLPPL